MRVRLNKLNTLNKKIVIVVSPRSPIRGAFPDIISILESIGLKCVILAGPRSNVHVDLSANVTYQEMVLSKVMNKWLSRVSRTIAYLVEQLIVIPALIKLSRKVDLILFSHTLMPLPLLSMRLLRKKALVYVGGLSHSGAAQRKFVDGVTLLLEDLCYRWANAVLVVSSSLTKEQPLIKYRKKTFEAPIRLLDDSFFETFCFSPPSNRENVVGFLGRFNWEKGIIEFADSISLVNSKRNDVRFLIIGDGPLKDVLFKKLKSSKLGKKVTILSWVTDIETYLKMIKLLVVPSISEGLPSVILEAMACGTLVLATPVGCITDLVENEKSGFLLNDLLPDHVSNKILEILDRPGYFLDNISQGANYILKQKYAKNTTLEKWRRPIEAVTRA